MSAGKTLSNSRRSSPRWMGAGMLSAIAASLCCITPVLALLSGSTGIAATFSWLEPVRPFLAGVTVIILGFAWWQKLRPKTKEEMACDCGEDTKRFFWQSKKFLGIVTVFAGLMLAFPSYAHIFYPANQSITETTDSKDIREAVFLITGMTCVGCEEHVKHAVSQMPGFIEATADHKEGTAMVRFDKSKTSIENIVKAINETGYTVTEYKIRE